MNESEDHAPPGPGRDVETSQEPSLSPGSPSQIELRWAGFWTRVVAFLIDLIILTFLYLVLALIGSSAMGISLKAIHLETPSEELVLFLLNLYLLVWLFLYCAYFILFLGYGGQTPGKRLLGIKVIRKDHLPLTWRDAIIRTLGYFISGFLLFGMGFLIIASHPQKRGLHDLIAGTLVIYDPQI